MFTGASPRLRAGPIFKKRHFILAILGSAVAAPPAFAQMGPMKVRAARVTRSELQPTMRLTGTIRPRMRSTVAAEILGLVAEMPADEGDHLKKGDLICRLRDAPRVAAHDEAVARRHQLAEALTESKALLDKAEFEHRRIESLWKEERGTEKEYFDAQADFRAAQGRYAQAQHALAAQDAVVAFLADNLSRTEVRAPFDGVVVARMTEVGSWVEQGGAVVAMVDLSVARARVNVPESIVAYCSVGADVLVTVDALDRDYEGKISRVIPDADERARTFPVEVDLPNGDEALRAGMFISAAVPSGRRAERLVVPKDAVVLRGAAQTLFAIRETPQGMMAMPVNVKVTAEVGDKVAVEAPVEDPPWRELADGVQVVVRGNEFMFGPSPVDVLPEDEPPAAAEQKPPNGESRTRRGAPIGDPTASTAKG